MPPQQQTSDDSAKIMQAIQKMLSGVRQMTGAGGGGSPVQPGTTPPPPGATIQFRPGGGGSGPITTAPPRPYTPMPMTEQTGEQSTRSGQVNAGLTSLGNSLSGIFNTIGQKEHAKKAALAENYLMQINGLLASGDPNDKQKAMMILEDPKIRKILKTGLEYVPLEEEVPPEAHGVQTAIQKIQKGGGQPSGQGGQPQGQPQRQPIIPQASQEQQLKAAMTSALLQKIKQDPAAAISMMGQSQMDSAEQHASEFYKSGLGLSPADIQTMTAQEKLAGLKIYEQAVGAAIRGEIDMYKAGMGYKGKVDSATVLGNARKYVADAMKSAWAARDKKKGGASNYAAGAKVYEDYAKKYLDLAEKGKDAKGMPLSEEQKKIYQQKADAYQRQADEYLNQVGDQELMEMFMKSVEEEPDASESDEPEPKPN